MRDSKNVVIGMLCAVVCIMAVAYAAFSTSLTVTTTTTIATNWCVKKQSAVCNVTPKKGGVTDGVTAEVKDTSTSLTTDIEMHFKQPGDVATCDIVYENCGSLAAKLTHKAYKVVGGSSTEIEIKNGTAIYTYAEDSIQFTVTGLEETVLTAKSGTVVDTTKITVVGEYLDVAEGQQSAKDDTATIKIVSSAAQSVATGQ